MPFVLPYYLRNRDAIYGNPCVQCITLINGVPITFTDNKPYFAKNPFASIILEYETYNLLADIPGPYQGIWNYTN
jgi:hypothetical protein